jgi:NAD(P)-dependent dehydrogenase (short-subunit alcohol dehydrogenase family)
MSICITGGSSGVGRAVAERFAAPGVDVFVNYHSDDEAAAETAAAIDAAGGRPHVIKADIGTLEGVREVVEAVGSKVDRLDQLVHAAATAVPGELIGIEGEELDMVVRTNGTSLAHLVREALPLLGEGSSILFVTSAGSSKALPGYGGLGAPKALAEHLARYLAREVAPRGARVNCISPGPLDTTARRRMFPDTWEERLEMQREQTPAGRTLWIEEVAEVVELLSRPAFAMMQGQVLTIDGGLTL